MLSGSHRQNWRCDPTVTSDDPAGGIAGDGDAYRRIPPNLVLLQGDAIKWLEANRGHLSARTLIYCDPPYVRNTRRSKRAMYGSAEMDDADHVDLINVLKELPCMVLISGYYSDLYAPRWQPSTSGLTTPGRSNSTTIVIWVKVFASASGSSAR